MAQSGGRSIGKPPVTGRLERLETRRLAGRAKDALLQSIASQGFPDGRLPSEDRLAEQLGVSRTTVREALRSLEVDGVVSRQHGVGTFVNYHVVQATSLNHLVGFYDLIRDAGYEPAIAWTTSHDGIATADTAFRLGRSEGIPLLLIERLFLADGVAVVHLVEQVPADEIVRRPEVSDVPESIFKFSERFCGSSIDHTVVEIIPIVADANVAAQLPLAEGEPLLRLVETHYSVDARPLILSVIHVDARVLRFTVVRKER